MSKRAKSILSDISIALLPNLFIFGMIAHWLIFGY